MLDKDILALLNEKNRELLDIISVDDSSEVEFLATKDGKETAKINGKLIHSLYRPVEEASKIVEKYELDKKEVIILLGGGLGYYIPEIMKKVSKEAKIYIIEDKKIFIKKILENQEYLGIISDKRVNIYHTSQYNKFMYEIETNFKLGMTPEYEIITNKGEFDNEQDKYIVFMNIFRDMISNNLVGTSTIFEFSKMWHKNSFRNMKHFAKSIGVNQLYDKFSGVPVIVVAAGPSLDKNIKYLHWLKGKAITIVVGTALRKVLSEGIEPDFVMGIDGGEPNWEHFRRAEYKNYPYIYEPMVIPKILDYHEGKKIVFVSQNIVGSWGEYVLGEKGFVKMGGSVAISAYDFGVKLGGNPVVLLGQDLAYPGGKSHVSGSVYEKDEYKKDTKDLHQMEVDDIYGGKVLSDRKFHTFIQFFERFINSDITEKKELIVIDATEGGAKIDGTQVMSLKDVYFKYIENKSVDVKKVLDAIDNKIDYEENISKLKNAKKDIIRKLEETLKITEEGIKIINSILNKKDYSKIDKLDDVDKKINKYPEVGNLVKFITQPIISETLKKAKEEIKGDELFKLNLKLYKGIKEGIEFNLECLEEV